MQRQLLANKIEKQGRRSKGTKTLTLKKKYLQILYNSIKFPNILLSLLGLIDEIMQHSQLN